MQMSRSQDAFQERGLQRNRAQDLSEAVRERLRGDEFQQQYLVLRRELEAARDAQRREEEQVRKQREVNDEIRTEALRVRALLEEELRTESLRARQAYEHALRVH